MTRTYATPDRSLLSSHIVHKRQTLRSKEELWLAHPEGYRSLDRTYVQYLYVRTYVWTYGSESVPSHSFFGIDEASHNKQESRKPQDSLSHPDTALL